MDSEFALQCNILQCRKPLKDHAVVTTCSHVFCLDCARAKDMNGAREGNSCQCPACEAELRNPDDVVVTNLNPTEDYKTSVLSGLNPNTIMECAGRALSFWEYQATQEITFQEFRAKNLGEKYGSLSLQLDKIINNANSEISSLRNQVSNLHVEKDALRRKNEELSLAFREKSRKYLQTQEMFDKMKRRSMLGHVQGAAADAVEESIQASVAANRYADRLGDQDQCISPPLFSNQHPSHSHNQGSVNPGNMPPPGFSAGNRENWNGFGSQGKNQPAQMTSHRQPLGATDPRATPRHQAPNLQPNIVAGTPMMQKRPSPRTALAALSGNHGGGSAFAGYGMSAGLKVSSTVGARGNVGNTPQIRSRGLTKMLDLVEV
ncbi:cyclin B1 interacting protein-like protein 1 [Amylocarpus encephaloides]|uniref:Cyclin B1 interacting protein-like protein 1 n=1 Tax=Amylocarpus encephaloides TaxID=45428 RepID=A0A9P7Y9J2_9HELO|nr:cyclin B1 interacting protein-like protein 1 [Amylocarpus encephaloides]